METDRPFKILFSKQETRRDFIKNTGMTAGALTFSSVRMFPGAGDEHEESIKTPWYRRTYRWGQTNINEEDPIRDDIEWWRKYWKETGVQGLVINAAGIVAYYPSKNPLEYRARFLKGRDLYGELTRVAHKDGLVVLARMDSNRAHENFYRLHPDWFAVDGAGRPYRAGDLYISCVDSPYYDDFIPDLLREVISWAQPEGVTDNSWSGLGRDEICYCPNSVKAFKKATGKELPRKKDWDDEVYRQWVKWSMARRMEIWDSFSQVTKKVGGPDCIWMGMLGGDLISQGRRLRDIKKLCEHSDMIMLDDQGRTDSEGFQENPEIGKRMHGLAGWDKTIPESMAMYQRRPTFRKASASPPEVKMWMIAGFAGTIQPWWHHVGAYQWDRRQFHIAQPVYRWYERSEKYLVNRTPVATVGVVWSQENADFYGRDDARELVARPYYGIIQALVRARVPYLPVHADHIDRYANELSLLILPNLASMTGDQVSAIHRFVSKGGGLIATGETSLYDEEGKKRADFALADLFGAHATGKQHGSLGPAITGRNDHTYLRLEPSVGRDVYGPKSGGEPATSGKRHETLDGFGETDILPFGGLLQEVMPDDQAIVPITFIPNFPVYPPEESWMRIPRTQIPSLVLSDTGGEGRRIYLAADIDRRFCWDNLPDHGHLLANLIRWGAHGDIPLRVEGAGFVDCHLYRQPGRLILHLVNLANAASWRSPVHEITPIGPLKLHVRMTQDVVGKRSQFLVSGGTPPVAQDGPWRQVEVGSLLDHEVVVFE